MAWSSSAAPKRQPPGFIEPCIPTLVSQPPVGPGWVHEIKHDGYRLIARKHDGRVRLFTRRGYDWTHKFPLIVEAMTTHPEPAFVVDGEAVCCDEDGVANFEKLHSQSYNNQVFLYAFDLLELDGVDWRPQPLQERKAKLEKLLVKTRPGVRFNEHIIGDGATIFRHACKLGFEGIGSKRKRRKRRGVKP
jgi:bifunctional non-homologous end joining protein LigD